MYLSGRKLKRDVNPMVILDIILCQAGSEEVGCVIKLSRLETCGDV